MVSSCRHVSSTLVASAIEAEQCRERHARRTLPLQASPTPLFTGFPGRLKSSRTWFPYAQWSSATDVHAVPWSHRTTDGPPTRTSGAQRQAFRLVQPRGLLVVHRQPLAPEPHGQALVAERGAGLRPLAEPLPQRRVRCLALPVADARALHAERPARPALTHLVRGLRPAHGVAPLGCAHHSFPSASRSLGWSSVRSATTPVSRRFSSRSCRNSRSSPTSMPA